MAAQTYFWTDADADHDFENPTGNNWVTENGTAAGAGVYPGSVQADHAIFDGRADAAPSVNLDQSANANGLLSVQVLEGYTFGLGTQEAPFYFKAAAGCAVTVNATEHGNLWLVSGTNAVAALNILATSTDKDAVHIVFGAAACTLANVTTGNVWFDASLFGVASAGIVTLNLTNQPDMAAPAVVLAAPVTTALNRWGGTCRWDAGTIALLNGYAGLLYAYRSLTARTLSSGTNWDGTTDLRTGKPGTITLTAPIAYKGGEILWEPGENLQRS
jgi:hypothetical protein